MEATTTHRADRGADRTGRGAGTAARADWQNVGRLERVLSVAGGGALVAYGLRQRGVAGAALAIAGAALVERGATGHCRVREALADRPGDAHAPWLVQQHGPSAVLDAQHAVRVVRSVTVRRPRAELYAFWRNLENLPRIMRHLESVTATAGDRSRWRAAAPAGTTVEWEAVVHNERPDELLAWKSLPGADVPNAGSVHFRDTADGSTTIDVVLEYAPPAGRLGKVVARLFGEEPGVQVADDLQRFKEMMEAGRRS